MISHHPGTRFQTRSLAIARELAGNGPTYFLDWEVAPSPSWPEYGKAALRGLFRRTRIDTDRDLRVIHLPKLLATGCGSVPGRFNASRLQRVLEREGIEHVLNANVYYFPLSRHPGGRYVYDLVDDTSHPRPAKQRAIEAFVRREVALADAVTCCSLGLRDVVRERFGVDAEVFPNGTGPFVRAHPDRVRELRERHDLHPGPVFVMVGRFGWWSGLELLEEAFDHLRREPAYRRAQLLLVGPGDAVESLARRRSPAEGFHCVGPVPVDAVADYLSVADCGLLPSRVTDFRHLAFPIKLLDYTAAHLPVVATPIREVERLAFPNVLLVPEDPVEWAAAMAQALTLRWNPDWDSLAHAFSWRRIAHGFEHLLFGPALATTRGA